MKRYALANLEEEQRMNRELIEEYPFLLPRNRFTGKAVDDYDYSYTELDMEVPYGWKELCKNLCAEIKRLLLKAGKIDEKDYLNDYRIMQVKEKFGQLRWYDNGIPSCVYDEWMKVMYEYEDISEKTCIHCGKPAKMCYTSWIAPFCKECWDDNQERIYGEKLVSYRTSYEDITKVQNYKDD